MPSTVTLPRKNRTRREWLDLTTMVDLDRLPRPEVLLDLVRDSTAILDQATRVVLWANSVVEFYAALARYRQRHAPAGGAARGLRLTHRDTFHPGSRGKPRGIQDLVAGGCWKSCQRGLAAGRPRR